MQNKYIRGILIVVDHQQSGMIFNVNTVNLIGTSQSILITHHPARACAARGKVISRGWWVGGGGVHKYTVFLEPIVYLSKYSLLELYFNTDRLLIEFNGLWYGLAARQVFVAIVNPDSLLFG